MVGDRGVLPSLTAPIEGYVFWTLFHGLGPLIWFYPLNELDITGYELYVLVLILPPLILDSSTIRQFFQSNKSGQFILKLGTLAGIASFQTSTTLARLRLLSIGSMSSLLLFICNITQSITSSKDLVTRRTHFWGYSIGLFGLLTTRVWYRTFTPAWNDLNTNIIVITIYGAHLLWTVVFGRFNFEEKQNNEMIESTRALPQPSSLLCGLGFGSLMFMIHSVLGEVSVPFRWVVRNYPDPGPSPLPGSLLIPAFMLLGVHLSQCSFIAFHLLAPVCGTLAFYLLYYAPKWYGLLGGLMIAFYSLLEWPHLTNLLTFCRRPGATISLAMITYLFHMFYSVWTVAYNFVPGGEFTREFSGFNIFLVSLNLFLVIFFHRNHSIARTRRLHLAFPKTEVIYKPLKCFLLLFILLSVGLFKRWILYKPGPVPKETLDYGNASSPPFTAMIWTYHFGYDNKGWPSLERSVEAMKKIDADIIGLLETDASKPFMGSNDLASWLSEELQMYVDFGPATKDHTWGNILLSRFPIIRSEHHLLPSPEGELAPGLSAVLDIYGTEVAIILTHMGNDRDTVDRQLQTEYLSNISSDFDALQIPVVFLGYVTSRPLERDYTRFMNEGKLRDIDPTDLNRFCQYILYNRLMRLGYARVSHGQLTDTEIQVAKLALTSDQNALKQETVLASDAKSVPKEIKFTSEFGEFYIGHYHGNIHHYHMSTPKYFIPTY